MLAIITSTLNQAVFQAVLYTESLQWDEESNPIHHEQCSHREVLKCTSAVNEQEQSLLQSVNREAHTVQSVNRSRMTFIMDREYHTLIGPVWRLLGKQHDQYVSKVIFTRSKIHNVTQKSNGASLWIACKSLVCWRYTIQQRQLDTSENK